MRQIPTEWPSERARWTRFASVAIATFLVAKLVGYLGWGDPPLSHLVPALAAGVALGWYAALRVPVRRE